MGCLDSHPQPSLLSHSVPEWLEILKQAKAQKVGVALLCHSAEAADTAKRQLYAARATIREKEEDKSYDSLSISMSPHSDKILYIYESEVNNAEVTRTETEASDDPAL